MTWDSQIIVHSLIVISVITEDGDAFAGNLGLLGVRGHVHSEGQLHVPGRRVHNLFSATTLHHAVHARPGEWNTIKHSSCYQFLVHLLLVLVHQKGSGQVAEVQLHWHSDVHLLSIIGQVISILGDSRFGIGLIAYRRHIIVDLIGVGLGL